MRLVNAEVMRQRWASSFDEPGFPQAVGGATRRSKTFQEQL
jgi:hypothetical protein